MTWPTDDLSTEHFDDGADSPADARAAIKRALDYLKAIGGARAAADGICDLDANGRVPATRIGRGQAGGTAALDANAKVPAAQLPAATTAAAGAAQFATEAETIEGRQSDRAVQPAGLKALTATTTRAGLSRFATGAETIAGSDHGLAVSPATLKGALDVFETPAGFSTDHVIIANRTDTTGSGNESSITGYRLERTVSGDAVTITLVKLVERHDTAD